MRLGMMLFAMAVILTGCGLSGHRQSGELIQKLIGQEIHFSDTLLFSTNGCKTRFGDIYRNRDLRFWSA